MKTASKYAVTQNAQIFSVTTGVYLTNLSFWMDWEQFKENL